MISVAAYELHITSTADAALGGRPGFVPDEYLNNCGPAYRPTVNKAPKGQPEVSQVMYAVVSMTPLPLRKSYACAKLTTLRYST